MKAVIMAGGFGTRLGPIARVVPKVLLPIGDRSVLEAQIEALRRSGFGEIIITTYHRAELLEALIGDGSRYGVRITYSREPRPLGTAGPLRLLSSALDAPFLVMNGDILTNLDFGHLYRAAVASEALLTPATAEVSVPLRFGVITHDGSRLTGLEEKPKRSFEVLAGIYVIRPEALAFIPPDTPFGMNQLIEALLERGLPVGRHPMACEWIDVGQPEDYGRAEHFYEHHVKPAEAR